MGRDHNGLDVHSPATRMSGREVSIDLLTRTAPWMPSNLSPSRAIDDKCGPMTCVLPKLTLSCGLTDLIHFMALGRVNDWLIPWNGLLFSSFSI